MLFRPVGGILSAYQTLSPTGLPSTAPLVETFTSVTAPPLTSASRSTLSSNRPSISISGRNTHNQGPSIFGPPCGKAGLLDQKSFIFSRNPSKGEKSAIIFPPTCSHVKFFNCAKGDTSDILLSVSSNHFRLVSFAKSDISDMRLPGRPKRVNPVNSTTGETSDTPHPRRYSSFKFFAPFRVDISGSPPQISMTSSPTSGDKSDKGFPQESNLLRFDKPAIGERSDMLLWLTVTCLRFFTPASGDKSII